MTPRWTVQGLFAAVIAQNANRFGGYAQAGDAGCMPEIDAHESLSVGPHASDSILGIMGGAVGIAVVALDRDATCRSGLASAA